jgi:hypothetical protein
MDKAYWGTMRWGKFRWGVYRDDWDRLLTKFKNVSAKSVGGIDPFVTGSWRTGHVRTSVYVPLFDELKENLKKKV